MMHLLALNNLCPPHSFSQKDIWDMLIDHSEVRRLRDGSQHLLKKILLGDSGIKTRNLCTDNPQKLFAANAQTLNEYFEKTAPDLGTRALSGALGKAGLKAESLDALFICTCTGYLCPGLSSYIAESAGLRPDAYLLDIVGQGCGAAIPTLRAAGNFLLAYPQAQVACIAVEICSAAFFLDDDPGVLVSLCLFGDGASASIWIGNDKQHGALPYCEDFDTVLMPEHRDKLRFVNDRGKLRNRLHPAVPGLAAEAVGTLYDRIECEAPTCLASHPGGKKVIQEIGKRLPQVDLSAASVVLEKYGNMSSPSVLFSLEQILKRETVPEKIWLTSFGAGVSCHSCNIHLPPR